MHAVHQPTISTQQYRIGQIDRLHQLVVLGNAAAAGNVVRTLVPPVLIQLSNAFQFHFDHGKIGNLLQQFADIPHQKSVRRVPPVILRADHPNMSLAIWISRLSLPRGPIRLKPRGAP